jgi:predicted DNA-binding transcriptional regulator AlpA
MSLEHSPTKQRRIAVAEHLTTEDLRVLSVPQWAALIGVSLPTAKRLLKSGDGPKVIQLSERRIGIRMIDHHRWTEARMRG